MPYICLHNATALTPPKCS